MNSYSISVLGAYGLAGDVEEMYLGHYNITSSFLHPLVSSSRPGSPPPEMPEGKQNLSKPDTEIPIPQYTFNQPDREKYPFWSAQLWNLRFSTLQDPEWRLRFDIWLNASSPCTFTACPVKVPHNQGRYLHESKLNWEMDGPFGSSNPTPEVWEAQARVESGDDTDEDHRIIQAFKKHHVGKGDFGPI